MDIIPWNKEYQVEDGHYRAFRIGDLCLVLAKKKSEWYVTSFREQVMPFPEEGLRSDLSNRDLQWERWEGLDEDDVFLIRPTLPPMPAISRPEVPVTLPPGGKARFFVGIPSFVQMVAKCNGEMQTLLTAPMSKVTYTWRGVDTPGGESRAEGQVCFSLRTRAHRDYESAKFDPGYIISVLEISNHMSVPLPFSRMLLETDYLNVYLADVHAWTNSCRFNVYDDKSRNVVIYAINSPTEAGEGSRLVMPSRLDHNRKVKKPGVLDSFMDKFKLHI